MVLNTGAPSTKRPRNARWMWVVETKKGLARTSKMPQVERSKFEYIKTQLQPRK